MDYEHQTTDGVELKPSTSGSQRPVDVTIGLDFGTCYTKICYRFYGDEERSSTVNWDSKDSEALLRSSLFVDPDNGTVHTEQTRSGAPSLRELFYIKIRLKDPAVGEFCPDAGISRHIPIGSEGALAAFYLATAIRRARRFIKSHESRRLNNREPNWEVNLGVPTQYKEEGISDIFRVAGEVALRWSDQPEPSQGASLVELCERFTKDASGVPADGDGRVAVFPEIAAALHQFSQDPKTPEGIHGFLDIGGGTLDACVFSLKKEKSGPCLNILATGVEPLGTIALSRRALLHLYLNLSDGIERSIILEKTPSVCLDMSKSETRIRGFIGLLLGRARDKSFCQVLRQQLSGDESDPTLLKSSDHFCFHSAGGGASSPWYKRLIEGTAVESADLKKKGIMPFSVANIEPPANLNESARTSFARFVVARGLSFPAEQLESVTLRLPSQIEKSAPMPERPTMHPIPKEWT